MEPDFLETLGFENAQIDTSKLVVGGHSFGGMTAIEVGKYDQRVKAVVTLDPWVYARSEEMIASKYELDQPQFHIISEGFPAVV